MRHGDLDADRLVGAEAERDVENLDVDRAESDVDRDHELDAGAALEDETGARLPACLELDDGLDLRARGDGLDEAVALRQIDRRACRP